MRRNVGLPAVRLPTQAVLLFYPAYWWPVTLSLTMDDLPRILVMVVLAAVLGYFADLLAGGNVPLGFFGSVLFGLVGAWIAAEVVRPRIPITLPKEPTLDGVTLVTAGIGAFVFSLAWCVLTTRIARRWR